MNSPIDYQKFISFIAILTKGSRIEKMLLLFSMFGKGIPDGYIGNKKRLGYADYQEQMYGDDSSENES